MVNSEWCWWHRGGWCQVSHQGQRHLPAHILFLLMRKRITGTNIENLSNSWQVCGLSYRFIGLQCEHITFGSYTPPMLIIHVFLSEQYKTQCRQNISDPYLFAPSSRSERRKRVRGAERCLGPPIPKPKTLWKNMSDLDPNLCQSQLSHISNQGYEKGWKGLQLVVPPFSPFFIALEFVWVGTEHFGWAPTTIDSKYKCIWHWL